MSKRAIRRHHRNRMKARAKAKLIAWEGRHRFNTDWEQVLGLRGDTFTCCSCWVCGNPRKWSSGADRKTMAERRRDEEDDFRRYEDEDLRDS